MSELRYHPFLGQWVMTAAHRQDRTFLPPDDFCPLCPTLAGESPTEVPFPTYDMVVFENKFPSLSPAAPSPAVGPLDVAPVAPGHGVCEVVCYSSNHHATFATLEASQVRKLTRVWQHRYAELSSRADIEYVFIFENKGREIGVTLTHPHGQIYAYPFVPPIPMRELEMERAYQSEHGRTLWEDWLAEEVGGIREVASNSSFVAVVPFFARYPFEVWVVPRAQRSSLRAMSPSELDALGELLHDLARRYDRLFGKSLPYIMAMHQEPAVAGYEFTRFHVEFYPFNRTANKLKYLAGSEAGAGAFILDVLPEDAASRLRSS